MPQRKTRSNFFFLQGFSYSETLMFMLLQLLRRTDSPSCILLDSCIHSSCNKKELHILPWFLEKFYLSTKRFIIGLMKKIRQYFLFHVFPPFISVKHVKQKSFIFSLTTHFKLKRGPVDLENVCSHHVTSFTPRHARLSRVKCALASSINSS